MVSPTTSLVILSSLSIKSERSKTRRYHVTGKRGYAFEQRWYHDFRPFRMLVVFIFQSIRSNNETQKTVNLGETAFPMRAGLPTKEPVLAKEWEDAIVSTPSRVEWRETSFTLHDGPHTNGNIHVGHAMNKISKDIIVRSKSMSGFYALYPRLGYPWVSPIEQVLAKQGVKRKEMDLVEYLKLLSWIRSFSSG